MTREHPKTGVSRQHFNRMAEQYDALFVPRLGGYDALHTVIVAMLPEASAQPMRVLELGIGTGNLTRKLLERLPQSQVVGYDLSARMLEQACAKFASAGTPVDLVEADIGHATFPGPFDAIISAIAVHHVPPRAKPAVFRRLYDALRPGGVLVIGDTFRAPTPELDATYRQMRAAEQPHTDGNDAAYEAYRQNAGPAGGSGTAMPNYLRWMRQAGFTSVDCVWKYFSVAVVYGERPR